jgi:hypothetical protein
MRQNFQRYIESMREKANEKGTKAKTQLVPDYEGPYGSSPKLGAFPTNAGGVKQSGSVSPYKGGKDAPDPNKGFASDGLGYKGGKGYENMPKTAHGVDNKVVSDYPKKTTMEWLNKNKNLSLAEFTKKIRNERLSGLTTSPSNAYAALKETFAVCKDNSQYVLDAVLEMKRCGLLETFIAVMAEQPETINFIAELITQNESFNRKLNQSIFEVVASDEDDEDEEEDEDEEDEEDEEEDEEYEDEDEEDEEEDEDEDEDE